MSILIKFMLAAFRTPKIKWLLLLPILSIANPNNGLAESGKSSIESFRVVSSTAEFVKLEVIYTYDGSAGAANIGSSLKPSDVPQNTNSLNHHQLVPGKSRITYVIVRRPRAEQADKYNELEIFILSGGTIHASRTFKWTFPKYDNKTVREARLNTAIDAIDNVDEYGQKSYVYVDYKYAKSLLDQIILEDPNAVQAYLELARISMKTDENGSEQSNYAGLIEARRLIETALKINPNYANSHILYGYVLGIQKHTADAIAAFKKAKQIGTSNMWLYYDWALALKNAQRTDEAIQVLNEGVELTPLPATYELRSSNHAIPRIFDLLNELLDERNSLKEIDVLYKKRLSVLNEPCEYASYARFKLFSEGLYEQAIEQGGKAYEYKCGDEVRTVLAAAYIAKWSLDKDLSADDREQILRKGQALVGNSQELIMDFANSPIGQQVLPKLKIAGFKIDEPDIKGMTPLAYSAASGSPQAVQRLISAGANPNRELVQGWTALMVAVAAQQPETVKVLMDNNADLNRQSRDGSTAISIAKKIGNKEIIKLLQARTRY